MSRGLALETSGRAGSIAITDGGAVIAEDSFPHGLKHAAEMIGRIDRLVRGAGWTPGDVRELYVSVGPGSFTGLRIAVTFAKTLALATGAKIVAVPSVRVLALNAPPDARDVVIVLDAKRDQIFTALLRRETGGRAGAWQTIHAPRLDSLAAMLARAPRPVHLIGEGIPYHEKFLPREDPGIIVTPQQSWNARAAAVAYLGIEMARHLEFTDPQRLEPIYLRMPEAQEKYEAGLLA